MTLIQTPHLQTYTISGIFFLCLISYVFMLSPYLGGGFIFDDFPNLDGLKYINADNFWRQLIQFITEGGAGELGRPISLFSFALQYQSWFNVEVEAFKYVNLMIHLLNGSLIFWILILLTPLFLKSNSLRYSFALLVTVIWLFHPIQISTVLYVVQRMAQLATLFMLLGILLYLKGRFLLADNRLGLGFFSVSCGVILGGILATFSKENGVLLVFYLLVLEFTLLQKLRTPRYWQYWKISFLYIPCLLLITYLLASVLFSQKFHASYTALDLTVIDRLLTQSRILFNYLSQILLITSEQYGLMHDDYMSSRSLLSPPITLFTSVSLIILFLSAIRLRKKYLIFSFSLLWFLAGHLLESSVVPLVLYFEHRNYLPLMGISVGLVYSVFWLFTYLNKSNIRYFIVFFSLLWLSFAVYLCTVQAKIWANPLYQANLWAEKHPNSLVAQTMRASAYLSLGLETEAEQTYYKMVGKFPEIASPTVFLYSRRCFSSQRVLAPVEIDFFIDKVKTAKIDIATLTALSVIVTEQVNQQCTAIPLAVTEKIITAILENPSTSIHKRHVYVLQSILYAYKAQFAAALNSLDQAIALHDNKPAHYFWRVTWLINLRKITQAKQALVEIEKNFNFLQRYIYKDKIAFWRAELERVSSVEQSP
ncbi:hypothetical protein BegalDRAFT_1578 [Beggiatoa alba B18LD]|uniref:Tetratricopeptide repeat protein n=1 Tax=Beggiatoa alba B18LD TaxID=395493 RepID=I3CFR5_9GAMM|nr:hypothetical protein [Beggiatoa alba]EIJ42458.1 hypothetical protein BegalDRAFT_1578 [Beggiatoa alba B18LD]